MKKFKNNLDKKEDWNNKKKDVYRGIMTDPYITREVKLRLQENTYGLYETPKNYIDGIAYNDGTWIKYNTCCTKSGKFRNSVFIESKKEMVDHLYSYRCFLDKVGITDTNELAYYIVCYVIFRTEYIGGLFKCNKDNIGVIKNIIGKEIKEHTCDYKDNRQYCFSPETKKELSKSKLIGLQRKTDKEVKWDKIKEYYDPNLTIMKNLFILKQNGIEISERTLKRWKKENIDNQ